MQRYTLKGSQCPWRLKPCLAKQGLPRCDFAQWACGEINLEHCFTSCTLGKLPMSTMHQLLHLVLAELPTKCDAMRREINLEVDSWR